MTVFPVTQGPPSPANLEMTHSSQPSISHTTFDSFSLSTSEDNLDIFSFRPTPNDNFLFPDQSSHDESGGLQYPDFDDSSAPPPMPALANTSSMDQVTARRDCRRTAKGLVDAGTERDAADQEARPQNDGIATHEHSFHVLGCDRRLFNLNLELSRQVQQYLTAARPHESPGMDTSSDSSPTGDRSQEDMLRANLLGDALNDASEFLAIIQSYRTERKASTNSTTGNTASNNARPQLGLIVFLNLLSVHLELVIIYEKLFQCLSNQLFDVSSMGLVDGFPDAFPGLLSTATSIQRGNLQTKILIHAILRQFEMIERILGLPTEFRVTEKQDDNLGVFGEGWARDLLEVIGNGKSGRAAAETHCGLEALSSLRELLRRVQTSLMM